MHEPPRGGGDQPAGPADVRPRVTGRVLGEETGRGVRRGGTTRGDAKGEPLTVRVGCRRGCHLPCCVSGASSRSEYGWMHPCLSRGTDGKDDCLGPSGAHGGPLRRVRWVGEKG